MQEVTSVLELGSHIEPRFTTHTPRPLPVEGFVTPSAHIYLFYLVVYPLYPDPLFATLVSRIIALVSYTL